MSHEFLLSNYPWVADFFYYCEPPIIVKKLYPVYTCICKELYHCNYDPINAFYDMIDVTLLDETVMCSLLHITYNWRNETKSWTPLRDRCVLELHNRNGNPDLILCGLF